MYARLRNMVASAASTAVGRERAAFWATRLPIAEKAVVQESSNLQAVATSSAKGLHRRQLDQLGLQENKMANDGRCFVSHKSGC